MGLYGCEVMGWWGCEVCGHRATESPNTRFSTIRLGLLAECQLDQAKHSIVHHVHVIGINTLRNKCTTFE